MSTFTALNLEPESDVEEEVDDSKEIQVEEALKLYQQALKLHSQGPAFYEEAEDAYDALFASEIFRYPEAQSEAKRLAALGDDESEDDDLELAPLEMPLGGAEAAPNSLPQILYLSYKNHGEFLVDRLAHMIALERRDNPDFVFESDNDAKEAARETIYYFSEALDRDETDSDLWRRTSRISRLLGSRRISRFCLEAALNSSGPDDEPQFDTAGLEGLFARAELKSSLADVEDRLSELQSGSSLTRDKGLSSSLKKLMDPFPKLPTPLTETSGIFLHESSPEKAISVSERSWSSVGKALLARKIAESREGSRFPFGTSYRINIAGERRLTSDPSDDKTPRKLIATEPSMKKRSAPSLVFADKDLQVERSVADKCDLVESPSADNPLVLESAAGPDIDSHESSLQIINTEDKVLNELVEKNRAQSPSLRRDSTSRPLLKRNSESAGLPDTPDASRSRSKRLRARVEPSMATEEDQDPKLLTKQFEEQLAPQVKADEWLFLVGQRMFSSLGVASFDSFLRLREFLWPKEDEAIQGGDSDSLGTAFKDFKDALTAWDLNKSNLLLHGSGSGASVTLIDNADDSGLASFLEHSKPANKKISEQNILSNQGLTEFVDTANKGWKDIGGLALLWVEHLLNPTNGQSGYEHDSSGPTVSRYLQFVWPITLKETVAQLIVEEDESIFPVLEDRIHDLDRRLLAHAKDDGIDHINKYDEALMEVVQSLFELHVDIYGKITNASSKVDQPTRIQQRDRMRRWASLSSQAIGKHVAIRDTSAVSQALAYRHLWSTVLYVSLIDPASREHVLLCLRDLKHTLGNTEAHSYVLPNNSIMPEISAEAAEREIARLTTMDFFLGIFDPSSEDPLAVIESLELILMNSHADNESGTSIGGKERIIQDGQDGTSTQGLDLEPSRSLSAASESSQRLHMAEFLRKASASLQLSLWHRLKSAYEAIDYPPMVQLCNIRSIEIILSELRCQAYSKESVEDRGANLVVWIRNLSDLLNQCVDLIKTKPSALECMDEKHLKIALASCADTTRMFHVFALWEDSVRINQSQPPVQASGGAVPYKTAMNLLRDMQPKCWMLLYHLVQEGISQNVMLFPNAKDDLAEYLMAVHNCLGRREYCRLGKKSLLKLMKTELIRLNPSGNWEQEMAQLVYDLYGLKICATSVLLDEHGCGADPIDRSSALEIIEPLMAQAMRMNIKDVLRSEIKIACEKMQAVIGSPRANSTHQAFNRRLILAHLKSPINPMNLYRSLKGVGGLSGMPVRTEYAMVAKKQWFFMQGHLLLARYRSQKRTAPDPSGDLDDAITFFKLDLDFDSERWEAWYRLAQAFDAKIEEDVTWSSDKINDPKSDLVSLQRNAINCYTMAVATAVRTSGNPFGHASKISEMYTDFGNRIYASSRAPFYMKAFSLHEYERFCNGDSKGTYKREPFRELKEAPAWLFAKELFHRALVEKPDHWINWYMEGKCLWKLFCDPASSFKDQEQMLDAFVKAVECAPEKRDSRHSDKDPILEPHYKLVSIVHKLVRAEHITPEKGATVLALSPHSRKVQFTNSERWEPYMMRVLKALRSADKANWHHRMIARAAQIVYDGNSDDQVAAQAAKHELTQQIFTRSMAVQVWKPEYERAGRHFVYTTIYVGFFVDLLLRTDDKSSLELLAKKLRKKQGEFIDHPKLWAKICLAYLKLIRSQGDVPEGHEDAVFKFSMPFDVFTTNASRLEAWAHSQLSLGNQTLDKLREVIELKKLNGNLMKAGIIDDLIGDTYARIYEQMVPGLIAKADEAENRDRMRIDRMLMNSETPAAEATTADQPAISTRPKAIGRTEVRRRAEALVSKLTAPATHWRSKAAASAISDPRTELTAAKKDTLGVDSGSKDALSSVPGSVHDSADDESELSEIEEGEEEVELESEAEDDSKLPPKIFPGLVNRSQTGNADEDGDAQQDDVSMDGTPASANAGGDKGSAGGESGTIKPERGTDV